MTGAARRCGQCQLCCELLGVQEIAKPAYSRCDKQCEKGCAIYAARPTACATFRCGWLDGAGAQADRPDRIGVLLAQTTPWSDGEPCVVVYERSEGQATRDPRAAAIVTQFVRSGARVIIAFQEKRRLVCRRDVMARARKLPEGANIASDGGLPQVRVPAGGSDPLT